MGREFRALVGFLAHHWLRQIPVAQLSEGLDQP
jgi:hypothetical protein